MSPPEEIGWKDLTGAPVLAQNGAPLGRVRDVICQRQNHQARYLILVRDDQALPQLVVLPCHHLQAWNGTAFDSQLTEPDNQEQWRLMACRMPSLQRSSAYWWPGRSIGQLAYDRSGGLGQIRDCRFQTLPLQARTLQLADSDGPATRAVELDDVPVLMADDLWIEGYARASADIPAATGLAEPAGHTAALRQQA